MYKLILLELSLSDGRKLEVFVSTKGENGSINTVVKRYLYIIPPHRIERGYGCRYVKDMLI